MAVIMNFRIITKNHAADQEIGFLAKSNMSKRDSQILTRAGQPDWKETSVVSLKNRQNIS